jgi:hypothetical protein
MYLPVTIVALALLTAALIVLRIFWSRLPSRFASILIRLSIVVVVLQAIFAATKWSTTSNHINVLINWLAIAGYELIVLFFAGLSPRWLTVPSTIVLLIPLFAATIMIPLTHLFDPHSPKSVPVGDHLFYEIDPWTNIGGGNGGIDIIVYRRSAIFPFLRHKIQAIPFNNEECNSNAASAIALPEKRAVLGRCPRWPSQQAGYDEKLLLLP